MPEAIAPDRTGGMPTWSTVGANLGAKQAKLLLFRYLRYVNNCGELGLC
jgi:hypothetical protein